MSFISKIILLDILQSVGVGLPNPPLRINYISLIFSILYVIYTPVTVRIGIKISSRESKIPLHNKL